MIQASLLYAGIMPGHNKKVSFDIKNMDDLKNILLAACTTNPSELFIIYKDYEIPKRIYDNESSGKYLIYEFAGLMTW